MKAYTIKSKGATIDRNLLWQTISNENEDYFRTGIIFFRKKDAKEYLKPYKWKEYYEIVSLTIEKSNQDNRKTRKK